MTFDKPKHSNYAATIFRVPATVNLKGLDNLHGIPVFGHQALSQKTTKIGDLVVAFTAETQLADEYAASNNLYRKSELNEDPTETGYLEPNGRVKAIKLRGHRSDAMLMPLSSLAFTGYDTTALKEGDTFDTLNGVEVCRKYQIAVKAAPQSPGEKKVKKAFSRVDEKVFPMHIDTDNYFRNRHLLDEDREVVVTQKLHGTSIRVGRVPVRRQKGWVERLVNKVFPTPDYEFDNVYGSRKVIKDVNNPNQQHYYKSDVWSEQGKKLDGLIPEGFIAYGELIGWTADGQPIQKNYTYDLPQGESELYIYRVVRVDERGVMTDLSWDALREFVVARGLKHVPELWRTSTREVDSDLELLMDERFTDGVAYGSTIDDMIPLSDPKTVDEGVCIRQEGFVPTILKAKSGRFLEHETKQLDKGEADLESVA